MQFSPKLYNWALSMGFTRGKTIPSVAFCSDENQGYPSLVITKVRSFATEFRAVCARSN